MSPTKQNSGWSIERRARQSALMAARNADPAFAALRRKGQGNWSPERRAAKRAQMLAQNADPAFHQKKLAGIAKGRRQSMAEPLRGVHPIVRGLFAEIKAQRASRKRVAKPAGIAVYTLSSWGKRNMPLLDTADAALGALGFELAIVPSGTRDDHGFVKKKTFRGVAE